MQVTSLVFRLLVALVASLFLQGCKTLVVKGGKSKKPAETTAGAPEAMKLPIGTIHHVDAEGGFVLIQSGRTYKIEPETELTAVGDAGEVTSVLKVSEARKGPFLSADILNGIPKSGQKVLMDYTPRPASNPFENGSPENTPGSEVQVLE